MNKLDLKIALHSFFNGKWYNILNITGLALGLAAFVFVTLYINYETGYDEQNPNRDRVYLVEREMPNGASAYTPATLAAAIKSQCPEVEEAGRMNTALFQIPFFTPSGRFLIKKWVGADFAIAKILGIQAKGFNIPASSTTPVYLLSQQTADALFPGKGEVINQTVNMASKNGMPVTINGVLAQTAENTNFKFDCIGFTGDIASGKDQSYATQIYQTYLLVKPGANINLLNKKIETIYKQAIFTDSSLVSKEAVASTNATKIYLDPLKNLHLKPHYGTAINNQIVISLGALAVLILIVTGVNFINLYISQANKRSKQIAIKKINGVTKAQIITQFLLEIFLQCLAALAIAFVIVALALPYLNNLLQVNLLFAGISLKIALQILLTLLLITLLSGLYPAIVVSGFNPVEVLRGPLLAKAGKHTWAKGLVTTLQFTLAITFVITLLVINQQINYMKANDTGFNASHVVYIDNLSIFNKPQSFSNVRQRIQAIPGVKSVTVASNIPGGVMPAPQEYLSQNHAYSLNTIGVDDDYFKTLNIHLSAGQALTGNDSLSAIINQTAARAMHLQQPLGARIARHNKIYTVTGIINDVKDYGFEQKVQPTIYLTDADAGVAKTQIMIAVQNNAIPHLLSVLNRDWHNINPLDGDNFNYHFLDDLYGQLFVKQEQLQAILLFFTALAVFIAALGFFALTANTIRQRMKEIAIRKVFGANALPLMTTISKPFFRAVLLSNLIAWPLAFIITTQWLQTFAYRVHLTTAPFFAALLISVGIVLLTVCLQIARAINFNPALRLKDI